jgi:2-iminoacetate synthase
MYNSKSDKASEFVCHEEILKALAYGEEHKNDSAMVKEILKKAETLVGLNYFEVSVLLHACENTENASLRESIFKLAREIKEDIYGKRIVMFAPLYVSNYCVNGCKYCGYHTGSCITRKRLTQEEVAQECKAIEDMGHKRIALEAGEDDTNCPIDYILECMKTAYATKSGNGEIRRINVNIASTTVENYRKLKEAGIGTYILFQETYHKPTYENLHPSGPKSDYEYHTTAHDRAMQGGIDDVGIGVLYGLYEYKYEVIATMLHIKHLEDVYGVGPHTISMPRIRFAESVDLSKFPYLVSDEQFKTIIATLRLAVPYTGMIISTREEPNFRDEIIGLGISQTSGGSCTGVGGYAQRVTHGYNVDSSCDDQSTAQFKVSDERSELEVLKTLLKNGYIPSFCTACYRAGRTGDRFMQFAKTGNICNYCLPNAMLTFAEYILDYGDEELNTLGFEVISKERENIANPTTKAKFDEYLQLIKEGQRDFRF